MREALPLEIAFKLEVPPEPKFGDLATNAALILAGRLRQPPRQVAEGLKRKIAQCALIEKVEVAGPGFLNLFLRPCFFQDLLRQIEEAGEDFGCNDWGQGQKVLLEFVSANPTGPLTIANGRGGFGGDVLARVLAYAGFTVAREFFVNDAGRQIKLLGQSILAVHQKIPPAEDYYAGAYIENLARNFPAKIVPDSPEQTGLNFANLLLAREIKPVLKRMGVQFESFFSEKELHASGALRRTLDFLKKRNLTFEQAGALWLKTQDFGDAKNRVLVKSDQRPTYFLPDLAYHQNKFERGFDRLIVILGADHHGYVPRLKIGVRMLGSGEVEVILAQLVKLFAGEQELRMSKRAGNFETLSELIKEVGADVCRWFFLERAWNTHLNFDLQLAKKQSKENPVFYVQYAYTRLHSVLAKARVNWPDLAVAEADLSLLTERTELDLIRKLAELPGLVQLVAQSFEVHRLPVFARELAELLHRFYAACLVLNAKNLALTAARLRLVRVVATVLRILLVKLIGVAAPEKM